MNTHPMSPMSRRAFTPAAAVAKSAVCVALVAGLAWIGVAGSRDGTVTEPSVTDAGAAAGAVIRADSAAAHRRQLFDERRARVEARTATHFARASHLEYPAP